jgi:hypothetical protein
VKWRSEEPMTEDRVHPPIWFKQGGEHLSPWFQLPTSPSTHSRPFRNLHFSWACPFVATCDGIMATTTNPDGSEDVNDFLLRIRELGEQRDKEDQERTKKTGRWDPAGPRRKAGPPCWYNLAPPLGPEWVWGLFRASRNDSPALLWDPEWLSPHRMVC